MSSISLKNFHKSSELQIYLFYVLFFKELQSLYKSIDNLKIILVSQFIFFPLLKIIPNGIQNFIFAIVFQNNSFKLKNAGTLYLVQSIYKTILDL